MTPSLLLSLGAFLSLACGFLIVTREGYKRVSVSIDKELLTLDALKELTDVTGFSSDIVSVANLSLEELCRLPHEFLEIADLSQTRALLFIASGYKPLSTPKLEEEITDPKQRDAYNILKKRLATLEKDLGQNNVQPFRQCFYSPPTPQKAPKGTQVNSDPTVSMSTVSSSEEVATPNYNQVCNWPNESREDVPSDRWDRSFQKNVGQDYLYQKSSWSDTHNRKAIKTSKKEKSLEMEHVDKRGKARKQQCNTTTSPIPISGQSLDNAANQGGSSASTVGSAPINIIVPKGKLPSQNYYYNGF